MGRDNKWLPSKDRDTLPLKETIILLVVILGLAAFIYFLFNPINPQ